MQFIANFLDLLPNIGIVRYINFTSKQVFILHIGRNGEYFLRLGFTNVDW